MNTPSLGSPLPSKFAASIGAGMSDLRSGGRQSPGSPEAVTRPYARLRYGNHRAKHFSAVNGGGPPLINVTAANSYDATNQSDRRRMAAPILRSEDWELMPWARRQLTASQRDIGRNFAVARWLIERHLDYVTTFTFKFRSKNPKLNAMVEAKMADWMKRKNSDIAGRHPFRTCVRLAEASALTANDCLAIKLASGKIQWIEGDRIANPYMGLPPGVDPRQLVHGVLVDDFTAARQYCVCRRGPKGNAWQAPTVLMFDQMVDAGDAYLHGFFDRFDQIRGVSPLACALNSLQDCYEAKTYALGRMKVDQLWALAVYRGDVDSILESRLDKDGNWKPGTDYTRLPMGNGPVIADLDPGDRMEALQSSQPSTQFQDFMTRALSFCLKALAIPYSFFDEGYTNYSGARQAMLQYEQAADIRRDADRELLDDLTDWRLQLFMLDDELPTIAPSDYRWEWVGSSLPWIDKLKEAQANIMLVNANLESEIHLAKQEGRDFQDIVDERKRAKAMLLEAGLQATIAQPDQTLTNALLTGGDR